MEANSSLSKLLGHELLACSLPSNDGANYINLSIDKIPTKFGYKLWASFERTLLQLQTKFGTNSSELQVTFE